MFDLSKFKGKKVALIGGAGFIGHNLALKLKDVGAIPHVVDSLQVNHIGYYSSSHIEHANSERYIGFLNERLALLRQKKIHLHL